MENNGLWTEQWQIPSFLIDEQRRTNLIHICHLLQDMAGKHAIFRKYGYYDVKERGQFWVLTRLAIAMNRFPEWLQSIQIQTWVSDIRGPFSHRNFKILDENQNLMGSACSLWVLLDAAKKRPTRITEHSFPVLEEVAACGHPEKLKAVVPKNPMQIHKVNSFDIDMIGHANNVKYLQWAFDHYKSENPNFAPKKLQVNYIGEALLRDKIYMAADKKENTLSLSLYKDRQNAEVCRISFS